MFEILLAIVFIGLLVLVVTLAMRILIKDTIVSKCSKYTINKFEPDNTAPKLTDMIAYHKTHEKTKYIIGK